MNTDAPILAEIDTTLGTMRVALDAEKAPKSVANFVQYAKDGHYDGLVFHRVIRGFMIQGGGYDLQHQQRRTRTPIPSESANGLKNVRGSIAMARTSDPNSATSQFFINHQDNEFLDYPGQDGHGYTVFGVVTEGLEVLDKIAETKTGAMRPFGRDVPLEAIVIQRVTIRE
jgi:cyclophilin family peptidyl-prolyl cis-trans isomerase